MAQVDRTQLSVSDTAYWIAAFRAQESLRRDALFHDPYAMKLAGEGRMPPKAVPSWALVTRTKLIDDMVLRAVSEGTDRVLNLAAGLDTRPYRLPLPEALSWIEADLAGIVQYKERMLDGVVPRCQLSREVLNLADAPRRRAFLERALAGAKRALVITEGLLMYLNAELVGALAHDFAEQPALRSWIFELGSPGTLRLMKLATDRLLAEGSRMQFAPANGVAFFAPWGWKPLEVHSLLKSAARYKRLPSLVLRFGSLLPDPKPDRLGSQPWGGVVRLTRA